MNNPKATILTISQFTFLLILIASCGSPDGACESKDFIAGENHYRCTDETENSCDYCVSDECAFSKGKSCAELGYTENSSSGSKHNPDGRTVPGANGKFANGTGGSTIGGINCSNGYQGPEFDTQIDSQCQTAYAYACSGSQAGVDAACAIYKTYQAQNSSIPNCPYCK